MAAVSSLVNKKLSLKNVVLIILLLLVGIIVFKSFYLKSQSRKANGHAATLVTVCRAEMCMHIADASELLPKSSLLPQSHVNSREPMIDKAEALLMEAQTIDPNDLTILCRKIIMEAYSGKSVISDISKLRIISKEKPYNSILPPAHELANLILALYDKNDKPPYLIDSKVSQILEENLFNSWFKQQALLQFYKTTNQIQKYNELQASVATETWRYIFKLVFIGLAGIGFTIAGCIVILYQLLNWEKDKKSNVNKNGLETQTKEGVTKFGWQTVVLVFLAWFLTQVSVAYIVQGLKIKGLIFNYSTSLSTAMAISLVYLFSNGPALLYIYFFALKPNGLKFTEELHLKFNVGEYGKIALAITGILGWLVATPLVLTAYLVSANVFGSSGSNNPIIGIVMNAAQSNNLIAISIFYLTLGILAPICEESLFRGFFYGYLRSRYGIFLSNILSSALFAVAHLDPGGSVALFCLGCVFAYLREKTGSIMPSIIAHGLWNSATFTLVLILFANS